MDYLLRFLSIDDVGDEFSVPGVCVDSENLEYALTMGEGIPDENGRKYNLVQSWDDTMEEIIDRAIEEYEALHDKEI